LQARHQARHQVAPKGTGEEQQMRQQASLKDDEVDERARHWAAPMDDYA